MKHVRAALVAGFGITAASVGVVPPSEAAETATDVTFTITAAGGLTVTAPASGTLADRTSGQLSTSGTLAPVTVTDQTGRVAATWTATVSATAFVNQSDSSTSIPAANLVYAASPTASVGTGVPAFVPGVFGTSNPSVTYVGVGNSEVSWTPGLTLTIPATAPVGQYKATITHSVA